MRSSQRTTRSHGFSLVEMMVALGLLGIILTSLSMVLRQTRKSYRTGSAIMAVENQGARAMREVVDSLRTADLTSLGAIPAPPLSAPTLDYQVNLGFVGTQTVWSDPMRLRFDPAAGTIVRTEDVGGPNQASVTLGRNIPRLLEGELLNGVDDNGNGLRDEPGFSLTREGDLLVVRLTIQAPGPDGPITRTWDTRLYCRN